MTPVIVLASFKGGPGKTTLTAALAMAWRAAGRQVALVDADPRGGLSYWKGQGAPEDLRLLVDPTETVPESIERAKAGADIVLVDTGGARTRTVVLAMAAADVVLVPCRASGLDAAVAAETLATVEEVNETAERRHRPVMARIVLTQVVPGSVIGRHIRAELLAAGMLVFDAQIGHRVAFAEAMLGGEAPDRGAAREEVESLVHEVETLLPLKARKGLQV